jgi:hypothetical protein
MLYAVGLTEEDMAKPQVGSRQTLSVHYIDACNWWGCWWPLTGRYLTHMVGRCVNSFFVVQMFDFHETSILEGIHVTLT